MKFQSLESETLAAVLLLGMLAGCAGGSKSSSCTNCVPPVKPEFHVRDGPEPDCAFQCGHNRRNPDPTLGRECWNFSRPKRRGRTSSGPPGAISFRFRFHREFGARIEVDISNGRLTEVHGSPFPVGASGP